MPSSPGRPGERPSLHRRDLDALSDQELESLLFETSASDRGGASAPPGSNASDRWTRSRYDKNILGVCGGLADCADLSPALVRLAFLASLFVVGPLAVPVYFLLAYMLPPEPFVAGKKRLRIRRDEP